MEMPMRTELTGLRSDMKAELASIRSVSSHFSIVAGASPALPAPCLLD